MSSKQSGYTLIELIAVMGIMATVFALTFVGIRGSREREELVAAQQQLVGDLRSAQAKAVSGVDAAGYGLEYDNESTYDIVAYRYDLDETGCLGFGDWQAEGTWDRDCPEGAGTCGVCKVTLQTVSLSQASQPRETVKFSSPASFSVYFYRAPNSGQGEILDGTSPITLEHRKNGTTAQVQIDVSGPIAQIKAG
jgi:prepilin-type N-terminal cleavage/methylation domain-containing protein